MPHQIGGRDIPSAPIILDIEFGVAGRIAKLRGGKAEEKNTRIKNPLQRSYPLGAMT
jgi:hypothetical protein